MKIPLTFIQVCNALQEPGSAPAQSRDNIAVHLHTELRSEVWEITRLQHSHALCVNPESIQSSHLIKARLGNHCNSGQQIIFTKAGVKTKT